MRLTKEQIAKYQNIYYATFNEHLSTEDALTQGMALARLVQKLADKFDINNENEKKDDKEISPDKR